MTSPDPSSPSAPPPPSDADKWRCPICLDTLCEPVVTPCGHLFCWPCIAEWLRQRKECPSCGGGIDLARLIPVYGQGKAADLTGPPPPRPEYIPPARRFPWAFDVATLRPRLRLTSTGFLQLIGFLVFAFAVFVKP